MQQQHPSRWKRAETLIAPPKNTPPVPPRGFNPFNAAAVGAHAGTGNKTSRVNLVDASKQQKSVAHSSAASRPNKRAKFTHEHMHLSAKPRESMLVSNAEVIMIDDSQDEDIPSSTLYNRGSSTDELNCIDTTDFTTKFPEVQSRHFTNAKAGPSKPSATGRQDDDEPIGYFSDDDRHKGPHVEALRALYEEPAAERGDYVRLSNNPAPPKLDLSKHIFPRKPKKAELMQRKNAFAKGADRVTTSSTPFQDQRPNDKKKPKECRLDIQEAEFDGTVRVGDEPGSFCVVWDIGSTSMLYLKWKGKYILSADIRDDCEALIITQADPAGEAAVVQLKFYPPMKGKRRQINNKQVTLKFDLEKKGVHEAYKTLHSWLCPKVIKKEHIGIAATKSLWQFATRQPPEDPPILKPQDRAALLKETAEHRLKRNRSDSSLASRRPSAADTSQAELRYTPDPPERPKSTTKSATSEVQKGKKREVDLPQLPLRRSTRAAASAASDEPAKRKPIGEPDEIILVYPQNSPGAVNITNADLARLEPGEFLNDNIIEFGLKLWLKNLEASNPELASQIHVFNSFFYKKLNQRKEGAGYSSVRKWTSKFDIFQKKYIIVPINENLHWYLAIIHEPEHVLLPPAPAHVRQTTPRQTRTATGHIPKTPKEKSSPQVLPSERPPEADDQRSVTSEAEIEKDLDAFQSSCSIAEEKDIPQDVPEDQDEVKSESGLSYVSEQKATAASPRRLSPTASDFGTDRDVEMIGSSPNSPKPSRPSPIAIQEIETIDSSDDDCMEVDPKAGASSKEAIHLSKLPPVPAKTFYQSASKKSKMKPKAKPKGKGKDVVITDADEVDNGDEVIVIESPPKTYIFTLDSLGSRHPQATRKLAEYLHLEARDKKGIETTRSPEPKSAQVPTQPNFCDCGVYLLHFVETFMSDPQSYCRSILSQKTKKSVEDRKLGWNDSAVAEKREALSKKIMELSKEWKESKRAKEQDKRREASEGAVVPETDSDSDIDILEAVPPVTNKAKESPVKTGPAARLR